jgi:hypothetical protein
MHNLRVGVETSNFFVEHVEIKYIISPTVAENLLSEVRGYYKRLFVRKKKGRSSVSFDLTTSSSAAASLVYITSYAYPS